MKTLRLFALALAFILFSNISKAQWVSIPDTAFGNWLNNNGYMQCLQGDNVTGWELDTTCYAIDTITQLSIYSTNLNDLTGIHYFKNLQYFYCGNNKLAALPQLPGRLKYLDCGGQNNPAFGSQLQFAVLPDSITEFNCANNGALALPALPTQLAYLYCNDNYLVTLPALPAGLKLIDAYYNGITSLPVLPNGLKALSLMGNYDFDALPAVLPDSLEGLLLWDCAVTSLPPLPPNLTYLDCSINNISVIPPLPNGLTYLDCRGHFATSLPPFPSSLVDIYCGGGNLASLPELPDSLNTLDISSSPLTCLPVLKKIRYFEYYSTGLTCLPNYPQSNVTSNPPLNSIPVCSYFNSGGCFVTENIAGRIYNDVNQNCQFDAATDQPAKNIKVQLWNAGVLVLQTLTDTSGLYALSVPAYGTYQISVDTSGTPFRITCPASGTLTSTITALDSLDFNMDFALECKPGFDLEAKGIYTPDVFRPAAFIQLFNAAGNASSFYNTNCAAGVSGSVTLSFTGPVKYVSNTGVITPSVTGNTITWAVADFGNINFYNSFNVLMQTDTTAQANQQICFTLSVTPTSGDNNPANNIHTHCFTVVNSYDPNDKAVYPDGNIDTAQRELVYTIRFQNTGNADAQHIYITDTLSSSINPASFQLLAYSHAPMVQLDGNKLRFNFPNINLPDSNTNEPASHGYVQFKVKLNNGLPVGTVINNTAFIYFDFNAPVVTNTTLNTIYVPAPPVLKPVSIGKYRIDRGVKPNGRL